MSDVRSLPRAAMTSVPTAAVPRPGSVTVIDRGGAR